MDESRVSSQNTKPVEGQLPEPTDFEMEENAPTVSTKESDMTGKSENLPHGLVQNISKLPDAVPVDAEDQKPGKRDFDNTDVKMSSPTNFEIEEDCVTTKQLADKGETSSNPEDNSPTAQSSESTALGYEFPIKLLKSGQESTATSTSVSSSDEHCAVSSIIPVAANYPATEQCNEKRTSSSEDDSSTAQPPESPSLAYELGLKFLKSDRESTATSTSVSSSDEHLAVSCNIPVAANYPATEQSNENGTSSSEEDDSLTVQSSESPALGYEFPIKLLKSGQESEIKTETSTSVSSSDEHLDVPSITDVPASSPSKDTSAEQASESLKKSGLSLLASQYDTDSDSDDVYEVPATHTYQNRIVEIDSDSSSSSSDLEVLSGTRSPINLGILGAGHTDEDDEENTRNSRTPMVKGEFHLDDLPPIQNLHITVPEEECTELGKVQSIVEQLVLVNSLPGTVPLDLDTVLFLEKGKKVLGEIFDVLGQVSDPLYCVRFNSNKDIREKGIEVGQTVYVAPRTQHTQFIVLANLMKVRGSDASWENDVEPPERFLDYSDDEEERTARRTIRNRNRPSDADDDVPKRQRAEEPPFPNSSAYPRPYRGNYYAPAGRQPHYPPPGTYNIAGNSWHSNFYQNYPPPHHQHPQYRSPVRPPSAYRGPLRYSGPPPSFSVPPPTHSVPPSTHTGLVINPYAVFPPPQLMQQPLFPPPPPPPPPHQGGY